MPKTQKALVLNEKQGPFVLQVVPIENPGPGQLLIKVQAAALNPVDWKVRKYAVLIDEYPFILGFDIAGEVEEVGDGVLDFKKGERILSQSLFPEPMRGGFQQYVITLAATTSKIPANLSYDEASTVPLGLSTAYSGLYAQFPFGLALDPPVSETARRKYKDIPILILGGSSSVGQCTVQLARLSGFSPIITTASLRNSDSLKQLGATHVLDRNLSTEALRIATTKITPSPVKLLYDSISEGTQQIAVDLVAPGGRVVYVLPVDPTLKVADGKEVAKAYARPRLPHNVELFETLYHDKVFGLLENGQITPNRFEIVPNGLAGIVDGLARLEADQVSRLKLVVHPQEGLE